MRSKEFDNLFRNEINGLEGLPPQVSWSKENGWEKLAAKLGDAEHKQIMAPVWPGKKITGSWLYSAAATLSLVAISIIGINHFIRKQGVDAQISVLQAIDASDLELKSHAVPKLPLLEKDLSYDKAINNDLAFQDQTAPSLVITNDQIIDHLYTSGFAKSSLNSNDAHTLFNLPLEVNDNLNTNLIPGLPGNFDFTTNQPKQEIKEVYFGNKGITRLPHKWAFVVDASIEANMSNFNIGLEGSLVYQFNGKKRNKNQSVAIGINSEYQLIHNPNIGNRNDEVDINRQNEVNSGLATYVTASYSRNIAKSNKKPFHLGLKAGYLIHDNTQNFDENSLSLELMIGSSETSKFKVAPVVYLTNGERKVIPGIKLGMTLGKYEKDVNI